MGKLESYKLLYDIDTDSNGYSDTIMGAEPDHCYLCGSTDTENLVRHELFRGPDRKKSKLFGLWIAVCPHCHDIAHKRDTEEEFHKVGQVAFNRKWKEELQQDFTEVFGRNYL